MTCRAWLRVVAMVIVLVLIWALAYTVVEYQVAKYLDEATRSRMEEELIERMVQAGRDIEEIRRAVEAFNRRYKNGESEDNEDRQEKRQGQS